MDQIDYSEFQLPDGFVPPQKQREIEGGVQMADYYGTGRLPWRIAMAERPWKIEKVKRYRMDHAEVLPVILFYRDKKNEHPVAFRRKMRYEDRVNKDGAHFQKSFPELDENGNALWELPQGFQDEIFEIAYERFLKGQKEPGLPITNWRATQAEARALAAMGIFTVEGFGHMSEDTFKAKVDHLPPSQKQSFLDLHDYAIAYANTVEGRVNAKEFGDKIQALEGQVEHYKLLVEEMQAKIKGKSKAKKEADE